MVPYSQLRILDGGAYSRSMTDHGRVAIRSGRCPNLLDSANADLVSSIRQLVITSRKITGPMKICGERTTGDTASSVAVNAEWRYTRPLTSQAVTLRSVSMLSTPLMQQSSTLTACGGVAANSRTGQRGIDR